MFLINANDGFVILETKTNKTIYEQNKIKSQLDDVIFENNNNKTEKQIFVEKLYPKLLAASLQKIYDVKAGKNYTYNFENNTFNLNGQKMYLFFRPVTQDLLWERVSGKDFQDDLKKIHIYTLGFIVNETSMNENI